MADVLPGFTFDRQSNRYRATDTGRFVGRQDVLRLLDANIDSTSSRLASLATALHEKQISPGIFVDRMRTEIRRLHLQNRALAAGGWDNLTPRDYGAIGRKLRDDYSRLINFANDIRDGNSTLAQSLNRANMYAGHARTNFWEAERDRAVPSSPDMRIVERRMLGIAEHCPTCMRLYDMGWRLIGELPIPGDGSTECKTNDRCRLIRREVPYWELDQWIGRRGGGSNAPTTETTAPQFVTTAYSPAQNTIDASVRYTKDQIAAYSKGEGVTPEVYEQRVKDALKELMDGKPIQMQFPSGLADQLLESRRFKTQFETGSSGGILDTDERSLGEYLGLGLPRNLDPSLRPVYGYVKSYRGQERGVGRTFGDLTFVLKDEVRQRAGYTAGDSLYGFRSGFVVSSPIDEVKLESMGVSTRYLHEYAKLKGTMGAQKAAKQVFDYLEYIEVQIRDGVKLSDIKTLIDRNNALTPSQIDQFKQLGITVRRGK